MAPRSDGIPPALALLLLSSMPVEPLTRARWEVWRDVERDVGPYTEGPGVWGFRVKGLRG